MSSTNSFTSSFLKWIPFISFSCLIALARTSNTMLNKSGKSLVPDLVPDFQGRAFSYSWLNVILAVSLQYMTSIMFTHIPAIKIPRRNISNLRYADDTTLMAESEELKTLLMKVKEESEKVGLKPNIQKNKIMASGPITSWQIDGESGNSDRFYFGGLRNHGRFLL